MPGETAGAGSNDDVYRSKLSVFTAAVVIAVASIFMIDALLRGTPALWLIAGSALLAVCTAAWAFIYKPCLRLRDDHLVLRGPIREITVPYAAVRDVQVRSVVTVTTDERTYSAWAGPERNRRFTGPDAAHDASTLIRSRAADARGGAAEARSGDGAVGAPGGQGNGASHGVGASPEDSGGVRVRCLWAPWAVCAGLAAVSAVVAQVL